MTTSFHRAAATTALLRLAAAGALVAALSAAASAQYCTRDECNECNLCASRLCCCHEPPEFWIINTRCVPKCCNLDAGFERISYKRYDCRCGRFVRESRESFLAQEANMPTMFYIHGNTLKHKPALKACWDVYNRLRCCPGKKRLVMWSWPAQIAFKRPLLRPRKLIEKNLRAKFVYSEYQGYYMAKLVNQMSLAHRVTLTGHSYGATTAAVACHYLGGGCLRGLTLEGGAPVERPNLRAVMLSGAFDNDSLIPGCRYGQAFVAAEKFYITRNCRDKTLDSWPKVSFRGRPALGVTGINANRLGQYRHKLCQQTLTSDVGRSHYLKPHLKSNRFVRTLCCISFPQCEACVAPGATSASSTPDAKTPVSAQPVLASPTGEEEALDEVELTNETVASTAD